MIDSIRIRIPYPQFKITNPVFFEPAVEFNRNDQIHSKLTAKDVKKVFIQRMNRVDKANNIYKPSLTITQKMKESCRELEWFIQIQVSLPKLIHGNSMYEITESNNVYIYQKLQSILFVMGIEVTIPVLENAIVTKCHISKNILLPGEFTVKQVLRFLSMTVANRKTNKREVHYENEGEALHFYTTTHGRIFYDKIKDLERTRNTACDKDRLKSERSFGKDLDKNKVQMLRFEVRYDSQQTVLAKFKPYIKTDGHAVIFSDIFKQELWKSVLINEWEDIIENPASQLALKYESSPDQILQAILKYLENQSKVNNVYLLNKTNDLNGTYLAIKNMGIQRYKDIFEKTFSTKTLGTRLEKKMTLLTKIIAEIPVHPIIEHIDTEIRDCKQLSQDLIEEVIRTLEK